jgi:hypothetical protein
MSHNYTQRLVYVNKLKVTAAEIVLSSAARPGNVVSCLMPARLLKIEPVVKLREGGEKLRGERTRHRAAPEDRHAIAPKTESTDAQPTSNPPSTMMTCPVM